MKVLDKITLIIFSTIMLVASIVACLLIFGWLDYDIISNLCHRALVMDVPSKIILTLSIIFILLSVKCIFFTPAEKEEKFKQGVLLENENGRLTISQETIENLVNSVAKDFESAEEVSTKIALDKDSNLLIFVALTVGPNAIIKELSTNLQTRIKEAIKKATDLEVKEVNIKVKNIAPKPKETNNN